VSVVECVSALAALAGTCFFLLKRQGARVRLRELEVIDRERDREMVDEAYAARRAEERKEGQGARLRAIAEKRRLLERSREGKFTCRKPDGRYYAVNENSEAVSRIDRELLELADEEARLFVNGGPDERREEGDGRAG
jgi:PAS domain-containing protein